MTTIVENLECISFRVWNVLVIVALMELGQDASAAFAEAVELIGGISDLNRLDREVLVKVGVFEPKQLQYTTVPVDKRGV